MDRFVFRFIGYKVLAHPQLVNADLLCYFVSMSKLFGLGSSHCRAVAHQAQSPQGLEKEQAKAKRTFKGELLGWLDAIAFAIVAVLLINQFIFQLYMIPPPRWKTPCSSRTGSGSPRPATVSKPILAVQDIRKPQPYAG
jgi:hypothetical protein